MKKLLFLFCLTMSLLIFASASEAIHVQFILRESALGRRLIEEEFNVFFHDLVSPPRYADQNYQYRFDRGAGDYRMNTLDIIPGDYLFRVTPVRGYDAYTGTPASIYTGREFTFTMYESWRGVGGFGGKDIYLQRRDQLALDVKVVDADTGYGISGATVTFGSEDVSLGLLECRFNTVSGGVMMGPELNSREMGINARPGDVQPYTVRADSYTAVSGTFTATPRSDNPRVCTELRIPMRRISTTPAGSGGAPPVRKSLPRPKSIPRL
jgi:hypothetical protein